MFKENKYTKWYYHIINSAKSQQRKKTKDEYFEEHHIIPTALDGSNENQNKVLLTPREHFVCHLLLIKMTDANDRYKMQWALHKMTFSKVGKRVFSAYQYNLARKYYIECISKPKTFEHKQKISAGNKGKLLSEDTKNKLRIANLGKKQSQETKEKMSEKRKGLIHISNVDLKHTKMIKEAELKSYIESGWVKGRLFGIKNGKRHSEEQKKKWSEERKGSKQPKISEKRKGMVQAIDLNGIRHYVSKEEFDRRDDLFGIRNSKVAHLV